MITKINTIRRVLNGAILFTIQCSLCTMLLSCTLDEAPRDQIPEEEAYNTPETIYLNTVATLYNYIGGSEDGQGLQGTCRGVYDLQTFGSDEAMLPIRGGDWYDDGLWEQLYKHKWTASHDVVSNAWSYLYKVVTHCNRSLEKIESHKDKLEEHAYQEYTAEVRALRAIYYWYLMDLFGGVPIVTSTQVSMNDITQAKRSEVFEFVFNELMDTFLRLPMCRSVEHNEYYGRVTYDVVLFVLAKLTLNAEIYTDDDWTDHDYPDGKNIKFRIFGDTYNAWEATSLFCSRFDQLGYTLEENYPDNFSVRNENSKENIWVIPMDKDLYSNQQQNLFRSWHYRHAAAFGFGGENGSCATLNTLRVFGYNTEEEDVRFIYNYWGGDVYDDNYDPVLDRTGKQFTYYPDKVELDLSGSPYVETAGARMRKYSVDKNATKDGKLMDNDIVLFRYADVLLMRAEAKMRNGEDGQEDFNRVRRRCNFTEQDRKLTPETLLDERLMELCWEGWRRQDMIRFRKYKSLFEGDAYDTPVDENDGHTTVFPIPSGYLVQNHHCVQNKGY